MMPAPQRGFHTPQRGFHTHRLLVWSMRGQLLQGWGRGSGTGQWALGGVYLSRAATHQCNCWRKASHLPVRTCALLFMCRPCLHYVCFLHCVVCFSTVWCPRVRMPIGPHSPPTHTGGTYTRCFRSLRLLISWITLKSASRQTATKWPSRPRCNPVLTVYVALHDRRS